MNLRSAKPVAQRRVAKPVVGVVMGSSSDWSVMEAAVKVLAGATEGFAADRMNRGIQRALAGRNIEDV